MLLLFPIPWNALFELLLTKPLLDNDGFGAIVLSLHATCEFLIENEPKLSISNISREVNDDLEM